MSIPVLVVPILNRPELLYAMLASVDHPVGSVIIIDNGGLFTPSILPGDGEVALMKRMNSNLGEVDVVSLPHNLGVAASWNLGMKLTPHAPYWLITNHDIEFGAGDLERLEQTVNHGAAALYFVLGMAAFAITRHTLHAAGYFDENIHPAYDEDLDFARRCDLAGLPRVEVGFSGTHVGSATIMSDPILRARNGATHMANDAYYAQKWGGPKAGGETFSTPFNRGGHVGDWRLDPSRLRDQAWPRSK